MLTDDVYCLANGRAESMDTHRSIAELKDCASRYLDEYTARDGGRAFWTYDRNDGATQLTPLDCLAPVLLSMRTSYRDVIPLFESSGPHAELLEAMNAVLKDPRSAVTSFLDVELDDPSSPWALVRSAFGATEQVHGLTAVYVSKVLHRKLPLLVPLYDWIVYEFYMQRKPSGRLAPPRLFAAMQPDLQEHSEWISSLARGRRTADDRPLDLLRTADSVIWQHEVTGCPA